MPFRPTLPACAHKPSSTIWLARQARDPYVKLRASSDTASPGAATSYRSRSAFKLLEMEEKWRFLGRPDVKAVLDLGAAPGGWSQVVAQKLGWVRPLPPLRRHTRMREPAQAYPAAGEGWSTPERAPPEGPAAFDPLDISDLEREQLAHGLGRGTIVAVDLLRMTPIPGVQVLEADFMAPDTEALVRGLVAHTAAPDGRADVILCDMAANATGNAFHDIESSLAICTSVYEFSKRNLRTAQSIGRETGGVLLIKHFAHPLLHMFRKEHLERAFNDVRFLKPNSSRTDSKEGYFLCRGWRG
ncbi:ribosomal RNA methyltransferase FtsJ domain-containing protein [Mycena sp. CBHHK59/15]|nr:ribosomal RNA methyltransferase FtsJ domain-containing protein [Mycena sp. CBHHK59/15]